MRARNIKPGFFKNEELADLGPYAQVLFAGLWCMADKAGRLEDRPRRIKAEIFPYYEKMPSIESLLNQLAEKNFIIRYKVEKIRYIQVINFIEHQRPHHTERESTYPSPEINGCLTVNSPLIDGENPPDILITDILITDNGTPPKKSTKAKSAKTPLPPDFSISDNVRKWADKNNHTNIEQHLESFINKCKAKGYQYVDWDSAFMEAIRENWGKIPQGNGRASPENGNYSILTTEENEFWQKYKNECYFGDDSISKEKARIRKKLKQAGML